MNRWIYLPLVVAMVAAMVTLPVGLRQRSSAEEKAPEESATPAEEEKAPEESVTPAEEEEFQKKRVSVVGDHFSDLELLREAGFDTSKQGLIRIAVHHRDWYTRLLAITVLFQKHLNDAEVQKALIGLLDADPPMLRLHIAQCFASRGLHREKVVQTARPFLVGWDELIKKEKRLIEAATWPAEEASHEMEVRPKVLYALRAAEVLAVAGDKSGYPVILKALQMLPTAGSFMGLSALSGALPAARAYLLAGLPYDQEFPDAIIVIAERVMKGETKGIVPATNCFDLVSKLLERDKAVRFLTLARESPDPVIRSAAELTLRRMGINPDEEAEETRQ